MSAPFKYDDDDWQVIADRLVLLRRGGTTIRDTPPAKDDRSTLESIVNDFVWLTARTDPRHPDVIATKNQLNKVAASIVALNAALAELDAMPAKPMRDIRFAMTGNCHPEGATFATWQTQTAALKHWAESASRWPVSARPNRNRSRGDLADQLIGKLLAFWYAHGGDYGQSATAPSTEFVLDAAAPVIELRPGSVTNFVRSR